jgi:hypothetical protein
LKLFEIQNQKRYGVNIYGQFRDSPSFVMATSLYHPDTVARSLSHDGSGELPGLKDPDGNWDLRPHRGRLIRVRGEDLAAWKEILDPEGDYPAVQTKMFYPVNRAVSDVMKRALTGGRMHDLGLNFSQGWMEGTDDEAGRIVVNWGRPTSWKDVVYQGSHVFVNNPLNKYPNATMKNHRDWRSVDLEVVGPDEIPITSFKPGVGREEYRKVYTRWQMDEQWVSALDVFRVAWRRRAANTGERTLMPALIPPGVAHVDGINSLYPPGEVSDLPVLCGVLSSLIYDFVVRVVPKGDIRAPVIERLPWRNMSSVAGPITLRVLRLNCLTEEYAPLWNKCFDPDFAVDTWTMAMPGQQDLGSVEPLWSPQTPLRLDAARRGAALEIDVLVALALDLSIDDLCSIYRTQFPVLYGYDRHAYVYDINGRLVPNEVLTVWRRKGDEITEEERRATNAAGNTYTYELPFGTRDREADMRQAYAHFEKVLAERGDG